MVLPEVTNVFGIPYIKPANHVSRTKGRWVLVAQGEFACKAPGWGFLMSPLITRVTTRHENPNLACAFEGDFNPHRGCFLHQGPVSFKETAPVLGQNTSVSCLKSRGFFLLAPSPAVRISRTSFWAKRSAL